ncbi:hypothetical protein L6164_000709 [Bauhinia variegata]|uniref:Uncharacterized protein n=1 Tax=Bauhinia variegata TaxID=167791 RepID=A0ACB9Q6X6_BAUVA|nr:hypothetical protein L6164_000709 [Bauhinia variegata]
MQAKHQMPSFKNSSRNPEKMKKTRNAKSPTFFPGNQTESHSLSSSARIFPSSETRRAHHRDPSVLQPMWSMDSLVEALPESPSPICSHDSESFANETSSTISETYYSGIATEFSTPRKQIFGPASGENNCSNCFLEIDEWLEHASKFCPSNYYTRDYGNLRQNRSQEENLSMSSICKAFLTVPDDQLHKITLPSVREEIPVNGESRPASINSPANERRNLISRRKPYKAFLNEIQREMKDAQRDALRKAKQKTKIERMRRKEAAIADWELQQTNNAIEEMMKCQNKLECKRMEASAKAHKKIWSVKREAQKRKANLKQSIEISSATSI